MFLLAYVLPKWFGPRNCINSSIVKEIFLPLEESSISTCDFHTRSLADAPPKWIIDNKVLERIESIESLRYFFPESAHQVTLSLVDSESISIQFEGQAIKVGIRLLKVPGVLERALIANWIGITDPITGQAVADFAWESLLGKDKSVRYATDWISSISNLGSYCQPGLNLLQHEEFCHAQREMGDGLVYDGHDEVVPWGMHIVIKQVLQSIFLRLPLEQKNSFLQKLYFLNRFEDSTYWSQVSNLPRIQDVDHSFINQIMNILDPLDLPISVIEPAIKDYLILTSTKKFNYVVLDSNLEFDLGDSNADSRYIFENGSRKIFYPSEAGLRVSRANIFKFLKVSSVTFVGCETPSVEQLLEFDRYTKRVLFIKMCEESNSLKSFLARGPQAFIDADSKVKFIEFNLSSLKLVIRNKGQISLSVGMPGWHDWLEWADVQFDKNKQAFRPRGVYDGIVYYR